jgi:hypothetical protein
MATRRRSERHSKQQIKTMVKSKGIVCLSLARIILVYFGRSRIDPYGTCAQAQLLMRQTSHLLVEINLSHIFFSKWEQERPASASK